jgi:hypothetical protein
MRTAISTTPCSSKKRCAPKLRQYLRFCTSKASKVSIPAWRARAPALLAPRALRLRSRRLCIHIAATYWYIRTCLLVQKYVLTGTKGLAYWYKSTCLLVSRRATTASRAAVGNATDGCSSAMNARHSAAAALAVLPAQDTRQHTFSIRSVIREHT